jgi:hypothetical protein
MICRALGFGLMTAIFSIFRWSVAGQIVCAGLLDDPRAFRIG